MTEPQRLGALEPLAAPDRRAARGADRGRPRPGLAARSAPLHRAGGAVLSSDEQVGPLATLARLGRNLGRAAGGVGDAARRDLRSDRRRRPARATAPARPSDGRRATRRRPRPRRSAAASRRSARSTTFAAGTRTAGRGPDQRAAIGAPAAQARPRRRSIPNLRHNALRSVAQLQKSLNEDANGKLPQLSAPARVAEEQLKAALAQLEAMTVGKADPELRGGAGRSGARRRAAPIRSAGSRPRYAGANRTRDPAGAACSTTPTNAQQVDLLDDLDDQQPRTARRRAA